MSRECQAWLDPRVSPSSVGLSVLLCDGFTLAGHYRGSQGQGGPGGHETESPRAVPQPATHIPGSGLLKAQSIADSRHPHLASLCVCSYRAQHTLPSQGLRAPPPTPLRSGVAQGRCSSWTQEQGPGGCCDCGPCPFQWAPWISCF